MASSSLPGRKAPAPARQASTLLATRQAGNQQENPVILGDFADPSVIRVGKVYYATATSSEWAPHFPLFQSSDLLHWQPIGYVFSTTPAWAASSFWAPELVYRHGTYYVYYVARRKSDGVSCLGVATSKDLAKGFTDKGVLLAFGREAIDPFVLVDNGQVYLTWKAYGLDQRPIEILGSRLSSDGLKVEGEPFTMLRDDEKKGLEGQCLVKKQGYYYLFYSQGDCCGRGCSYQVGVARAATVRGPYTRCANNPLLAETAEWKCTGHGTVVTSSAGKDFFLYHAYSKASSVYTGRQGMLSKVTWDKSTGWPALHPVKTPAATKQQFLDDFSTAPLADAWQWDFRHTQPAISIKAGTLALAGRTTADNLTGTVLTVRPLTGNYEMRTEVVERNVSLKGLVLYGDADQAVGIGIRNDTVEVWQAKDHQRTVLQAAASSNRKPVQLKLSVEQGYQCRFFWRENGGQWQQLITGSAYYNGAFLPLWDRSPRPGLLHQGAASAPALFSFFEINYQ